MRPSTRSARLSLRLLAAILAFPAGAPLAATTYNVATFADDAIANGNCTLREALRAANGNVAVDACTAGTTSDSIVLPAGTYGFSGEEALGAAGSLSVMSVTLNPFDVVVNLGGTNRFLALTGGGKYVIAGIGIANGLAGVGDARGGAIRADDVTLSIFNFRFVSNHGGSEGGALYYSTHGAAAGRGLTMANGTFLDNHVTNASPPPSPPGSGGAAYVGLGGGNHADLRDVAFIGNSVSASGSDVLGGALALRAEQSGSAGSCVRCSFTNNSGLATAGAVHGGAAFVQGYLNATVGMVDCRFTGNSASAPGSRETAALFAATNLGGAVDLERLFIDFNAGANGADSQDVYLQADAGATLSMVSSQLTFGAAAGLFAQVDGATLRLGHLTIADYPSAGAIFRIFGTGQAVLQNSIVALNAPGNDVNVMDGVISQTTNFIGGNPLFLDEPNGDYRLAAASPAIDAGTSWLVTFRAADLDHRSRRQGLGTDIGCYERGSLFADDLGAGDFGAWSGVSP